MRQRMVFLVLAILAVSLFGYAQANNHWSGLPEGARQNMSSTERFLVGEGIPYDPVTFRPPENGVTAAAGRIIFEIRCAVCHGLKGDGNGQRAGELKVKPRDFTFAVFKFRTTPTGKLPTDEDLFKTISRGLHGTAMLPWFGLTPYQRWLTVYYIKSFSGFFDPDEKPPTVKVPSPSKSAAEYIRFGKEVYGKAKCFECHGKDGYGDGMKNGKLKDDWLRPIEPTNFREDIPKRGLEIEDAYLSIATGLNGTPMPSYSTALSGEEMLAVSYYVQSLAPGVRHGTGRLRFIRRDITADELAGLKIDHMMGVRFRWPWQR